jgi:hypothetical protein
MIVAYIIPSINIVILLFNNSLMISVFELLYYSNWHEILIYILLYFLLLLVLYRFKLQPVMKRTQAGAILLAIIIPT